MVTTRRNYRTSQVRTMSRQEILPCGVYPDRHPSDFALARPRAIRLRSEAQRGRIVGLARPEQRQRSDHEHVARDRDFRQALLMGGPDQRIATYLGRLGDQPEPLAS